jgi:hypothetical protein
MQTSEVFKTSEVFLLIASLTQRGRVGVGIGAIIALMRRFVLVSTRLTAEY